MLTFDQFPPDKKSLFRNRKPVDIGAIRAIFAQFGDLPPSYEAVLSEIGSAEIKGPDEPENYPAHLILLPRPISAISQYYLDCQILENGAAGDVLIVATDSMGTAFGFDTGASLKFVEVDNYRIAMDMELPMDQWIFGIAACWPENPISCAEGVWLATDGVQYTQTGPLSA